MKRALQSFYDAYSIFFLSLWISILTEEGDLIFLPEHNDWL